MPGVFRDSRKPFGRARQKCIDMLEDLGVRVSTCDAAVGHWRTSSYADVYRWEFTGTRKSVTVCGGCWNTMTQCAKAGRLYWNGSDDEVTPYPPTPGPFHCAECGEMKGNFTTEICC